MSDKDHVTQVLNEHLHHTLDAQLIAKLVGLLAPEPVEDKTAGFEPWIKPGVPDPDYGPDVEWPVKDVEPVHVKPKVTRKHK